MEELNQKKVIEASPRERLVKVTFYITYAFLLTTATIKFRNLYFYSSFIFLYKIYEKIKSILGR